MSVSLTPNISKFGEEFDAEKSSQYRLTIQFALDGLSYALLDTDSHRLIALESYQSDLLADSSSHFRTLERALESKGLNNKIFQSITCIIDDRINTLIPETLFDEASQKQYLDFAFQLSTWHAIQSDLLNTIGCYNIFACSNDLRDKVLSKWKQAKIIHSSSVFINSVVEENRNEDVSLYVRNDDFDMVILKEGKLQFFNNFRFNTKDDFAYFLMLALEQNGLSGQDTTVWLSGLILPYSKIIDLCSHYIKEFRFVEDPHKLQVSKAIQEIPFQYYYIHYQALK